MAARDAPMQVRVLTVEDLGAYRALHRFGLREAPQAFVETLADDARRPDAAVAEMLARGEGWPGVEDQELLATAEEWLLPHLAGVKTEGDIRGFDLVPALQGLIGWDRLAEMDRLVPGSFETPLGRKIPIDYEGEVPAIEVRLQEMFGVTQHPVVGQARMPV